MFKLPQEQTISLEELNEVLQKKVDPNLVIDPPVSYSACGCGCTTDYYVTCATLCYLACSDLCAESCANDCMLICNYTCIGSCKGFDY